MLCVHSPGPCFSHYANSTIIYLGVLMGLTQVMLQVKGCEMVCKQRELIPRLRRLSPASTELYRYPPPPPPPTSPSLSNSLRQHSAEAVRGHQKGTQTQREMPSAYKNETRSGSIQFTPLAQHHSTSIQQQRRRTRAPESAALQPPWFCGWPARCHTEPGLILQKHCF